MAEENQEQVVVQKQEQQPASGPQRVPISEMLKGMLNPKDREALLETEKKLQGAPTSTPKKEEPKAEEPKKEEPKKEEPKKEEPKKETPKAEGTDNGEEKKEEKKEVDTAIQSKFGLGKKKGEDIVIENEEQLLGIIKKDFGQDIKDLKGTGKFFETAKDWRTKATQYDETAKKLKETEDALVALPETIIQSMQAFYKGEDYTKPFAERSNLDYEKPAAKQDKVEMIKQYFPTQFKKLTTEEIDAIKDGEIPEKVEPLLEASVEKFNTQVESRNAQRATQMERAKQYEKAYKQSVSSSVEHLEQSFPGVDKEIVTEASQILSGGMKELQKLFLNNDGTLKKEAAKFIMLAKHGEEEMKKLATISAHKAESKANEDILTRGTDKPTPKKSGNGQDGAPKVSKEVQKQVEELGKVYGQKKVF